MKTSIKALGAALALTIAASAPALANDGDPSSAGIPFNLQHDQQISNVQVSGFTGVSSAVVNQASDPRSGGLPVNLQSGFETYNNTMVSGFTGIASGAATVNEAADPRSGGLPYNLQMR